MRFNSTVGHLVIMTIVTACTQTIIASGIGNRDSILASHLRKYKGRPIYELITDDSVRRYSHIIYVSEPPGNLSKIVVVLKDNIVIYIYIGRKRFIGIDFRERWKFSQILKEEISSIVVIEDIESKWR